jgi:sucrose phosphorylase
VQAPKNNLRIPEQVTPEQLKATILEHLAFLYGTEKAGTLWKRLETLLSSFHQRRPELANRNAIAPLSEKDAILITYGDQFREPGIAPLQTLNQVLVKTLDRVISGVHILPFFPYSSDDGFSVIDYAEVNPSLGTWADVERLGHNFRLMFDAVVNHISRQSDWFTRFLAGDPSYADWFIVVEPDDPQDWVPLVTRPRPWPLLTSVQTATSKKLVWTTFSEDQIDLNYAHPEVLLRILEILLFYVEKGAQMIRLDAIAYLWKTIGTECIHLEETHRVVKLMRAVLDAVAPGVILITETNVPHEENVSYFGELVPGTGRTDEAQLVYQFPLAPLVMHSLLKGNAQVLSRWAAGLETPAPKATFFNFTASHDGIGLMPARGLLSDAEVEGLVNTTLAHGGQLGLKSNPDGSQSVYELNISYFDALSDPASGEPLAVQVSRFICSQAIMLSLAGLPGIYVHSLLGSRSWQEGVSLTGHNRSINREKLERASVERELADPTSLRHRVFAAYSRLLRARSAQPAFHPCGEQRVLFLDESVFALLRIARDGSRLQVDLKSDRVLCLHNVSDRNQVVQILPADLELEPGTWRDILTGENHVVGQEGLALGLPPYSVFWLRT